MPHSGRPGAVGPVKKHFHTFCEPPHELALEGGGRLGPITLAYETYGRLNRDKSNAILVLHALTGDSHAAGVYRPDDAKPGWWDYLIGPGRPVDTDRYFVVCSNVIGGCQGSTGPASVNPATGRPYGLTFPVITVNDMVRAQAHLVDHLGIGRLLAVLGGSMGGMQALVWSVLYPDRVAAAIPIATTAKHSPQQIAFNQVGRAAIMADPNFNGGDYYGGEIPRSGLSLARMVGHITYRSDEAMHERFGRKLRGKKALGFNFGIDFEVESFLHHQGDTFVERFDANAYLYITKAIDYFDLSQPSGSLTAELARAAKCRFLVISFTSDWLYPPYQSKEIVKSLMVNGIDATYSEIKSSFGHDAFLLPGEMDGIVGNYLANLASSAGVRAPGHTP